MARACFVTAALCYFILVNYGVNTKVIFELLLEKLTDCANPQPPFTDKRMVTFEINIQKIKGKTYLNGENKVLQEVPFSNYSTISYSITASGGREQVYKVDHLNCRSFMGKTFLIFGNFRYNKTNCHLLKSAHTYKDFDVDKVSHSIPNWHYEGSMVHRVSLVFKKRTVFCLEAFVSIKTIK